MLSSSAGFYPERYEEALFLVCFPVSQGIDLAKVRIADMFLHVGEGVGGIWIIVWGSEDILDKGLL